MRALSVSWTNDKGFPYQQVSQPCNDLKDLLIQLARAGITTSQVKNLREVRKGEVIPPLKDKTI